MTPALPGAFPPAEYSARLGRAQEAMAGAGLGAVLLTTNADILYFTGFLTRFWESPTRPWFLVLPVSGAPVAVIPGIGEPLMARTWVSDIRCWNAPDPDDDGVGLLVDTLTEAAGPGGRVGLPTGMESHLRMPLDDWERMRRAAPSLEFVSDTGLVRGLRMVKSAAEIQRVETACAIAGRAFARVPEIARAGTLLDAVFRDFQMLCLDEGADWVPYLAGASGQGGYEDVISPAGPEPLRPGDVLMLDAGLVRDGYYCDFDRNYSVGPPASTVRAAHATLVGAASAAFDAARPGARACDLFHIMNDVLAVGGDNGGASSGRLGHGLGLQLTEGMSLVPSDMTMLKPGMVLTLEPVLALPGGKIMVHEENISITENGAEYLSPAAPAAMPELEV